jgi:plastocyanin
MARRAAAAAAVALAGAVVALAGAAAGDARTRTTSVGIGEREFKISVYRKHVLPGKVRFNIQNYGEDSHDLRVIGPGSTGVIRGASPEVKAGDLYTLKVTLKRRGLYTLVCTLDDHESRGMVARMRVVRKL